MTEETVSAVEAWRQRRSWRLNLALIIVLVLLAALLLGLVLIGRVLVQITDNSTPAYADVAGEIQKGVNSAGGNKENTTLGARLEDVVNILLYVLGAIAVIMIVIGGIRYATSNGESSQISSAKNTILYAVIGLIVAVMAYAIVNFVLDSF